MKLYKYRSLDNLWKILDIFINKRFYVAHWKELNDPMESRYYLISPVIDAYLKILDLSPESLINTKEDFINKDISDALGIEIKADTTRRDFLSSIHQNSFGRILSFSKDPFNYLMWSHYSDSHKGIVIEVDFPDAILNQSIVNLYMNYGFGFSNICYKEKLDLAKDYERRFTSLMRRKNIMYVHPYLYKIIYNFYRDKLDLWSYEQEARFISGSAKYLYLNKFNAKITKILIGCKIDPQKESILRSIIKDIPVVKVKCNEGRILIDTN